MAESIKQIHSEIQEIAHNNRRDKVDQWLSPSDPSSNYNKALSARYQDSGRWFLQSDSYSTWKTEPSSFLWLHGIPGCGKTVLSSTIIEDLKRSKTETNYQPILYFYFDFTDINKQSLDNAIRSLISQLYKEKENVRKRLDILYSSSDDGRQQPTIESLCALFQSMVQEAGEVWVVLDALDECQKRNDYPAGGLLAWIESLRDSHMNIHLLITSRPEQDIEEAIAKIAWKEEIIPLQSDLIQDDIRRYIEERVRHSNGLSRWHKRLDIQRNIKDTLIEKANGM